MKTKLNMKQVWPLAGIAAIAGMFFLVVTFAANPFASIEAESGTISGAAVASNDTNASGGRFVRFNAVAASSAPKSSATTTTLPAFPGAEGFGSTTIGGRGGTIKLVTNLNDSGSGSFRAAVQSSGPRIVVFKVAGTINLQSPIDFTSPYITVLGQTAPRGGITLKADFNNNCEGTANIKTHDVVVRFMRFRSGACDTLGGTRFDEGNPLDLHSSSSQIYNVVIDHNSFSWAANENLTTYRNTSDITLSWNITSEALNNAGHPEGPHSRGLFVAGDVGSQRNISIHHNLIVNNDRRNPEISLVGTSDVVNNIIYNWGQAAGLVSDKYQGFPVNFVKNLWKRGPKSRSTYEIDVYHRDGVCYNTLNIYAEGNISPRRPNNTYPEHAFVENDPCYTRASARFDAPAVTTFSPQEAYDKVLAKSGAVFPFRDSVDERAVSETTSGTCALITANPNATTCLIDNPSQVGGWPALPADAPPADSDNDGMPDSFEGSTNLSPSGDRDGDGYTNIEEYANSLVAYLGEGPGPAPSPGCGAPGGSGVVAANLNVETPGNYRAWSRIKAASASSNSYWLNINNECKKIGDFGSMPANTWTWVDYQNGDSANKVNVNLSAGSQAIKLIGNEVGLELDKLIFTLDQTCVPAGTGENCTTQGDTTAPTAPTNLSAAAISHSTISLNWSESQDESGIREYEIERKTGSEEYYRVGTSATNTYNDPKVLHSTTYTYRVRAVANAGNPNVSSYSTPASATTPAPSDTTPPSKPTGLVTTPISKSQIRLEWQPSTDVSGIYGYEIQRRLAGVGSFEPSGTTTGTSYTDFGLEEFTRYEYQVRSMDTYNNFSLFSDPAVARTLDQTAPSVPGSPSETGKTATTISITWGSSTDAHSGVKEYRVYRDNQFRALRITTTYTDAVDNGSTHTYRVSAVDNETPGNESGQSAPVTITAPDTQAPTWPANTVVLSATQVNATNVALSWHAANDNVAVTGYDIFRGGADVGDSAATIFYDSGLNQSTTYTYFVRAKDAAGNQSVNSNQITVTTRDSAPPTQPTNLRATSRDTSVALNWNASTDNIGVKGYNVFRSVGNANNFQPRTFVQTNSFTDTDVTRSTSYFYYVIAIDYETPPNQSLQSNRIEARTKTLCIGNFCI